MSNITKNRLVAYQQYTSKLERTLHLVTQFAIIFGCTTLIALGYIVWRGL